MAKGLVCLQIMIPEDPERPERPGQGTMSWEMAELLSVSVEGQEVGRRSRDIHGSSEAVY